MILIIFLVNFPIAQIHINNIGAEIHDFTFPKFK